MVTISWMNKEYNLTFPAPIDHAWDAWGHYHIVLGLLFWHDQTADKEVLRCVRKIADMFCAKFLDGGQRLASTGSEEMNLAPIHSLCLLYERTRENRYLAMAREIERDFEVPPAGDYIQTALAGKEFFQTPKPRWERLHLIHGIAELYFITGEEKYRQAFEPIFGNWGMHLTQLSACVLWLRSKRSPKRRSSSVMR